jgi:hypothetical protein
MHNCIGKLQNTVKTVFIIPLCIVFLQVLFISSDPNKSLI